ncbi:MAG: RNA polymerase sigma factor [Myxococcales bacterium]|nr:RNA polymerase sigma factor [Myxococcales bacterium]
MTVDLRLVAARVAKGDVAAYRAIVEHTRAPLYRLAARLTGNLVDAEDVLQDAYLSGFRALSGGKYDGNARIETWLYRIVTNASIDALRKRKVRSEGGEPTSEPRFDGNVKAEARVALRELDAMLADLAPQDRAALVLVSVEGLTAKEAAEALECTEGALEQRLVRARAAIRKAKSREEAAHD